MLRRRLFGTFLAGVLLVGLLPAAAGADRPLDVDCDVLETTLLAVDGVLPAGTFDSLGDLVSTAKKDPATFAFLNGLVFAFSFGAISFDDPKEVVPTVAKCGLTPLLNELIKD